MKSRYAWIVLLIAIICAMYRYDYHKTIAMKLHFFHDNILTAFFTLQNTFASSSQEDETLFSVEELKKHSNIEEGLYLAILGQIYDVTKGEKHYGPGGSYHYFVGRDASLAFVTGDFTEAGLIDDVSSLTAGQIRSLNDWALFYAKDYVYKGKLVGRYYDSSGNPTEEYRKVEEKLAEDEKQKSDEEMRKRIFPPCNIEWKPEVGTRVWCTKRSGGIERNWVGVPRMLYEPGSDQHRCTCVNLKSKDYDIHKGNLREYEGCAEGSANCMVKNS